ncbi:rhodanese-like domain-containing protein [Gracilibacillus sp. YIM 98692]|uniref:rhodanese-like domain-containing protein n=1 Tax=Gracilibacillus sp. YIM 98692 TaxID=2663532 RepID=UPI0013D05328|nr:rhodanese-like domain-containing protein [Gracilibacillus sp. YIM 98692]
MRTYTAKEVEKRLEAGEKLNLLDVREAEEVKEGKISKATNIPLGVLEFRLNELDKSKEYVVVCRSGGRSAKAVYFLENQGYDAINMTGGMLDWEGHVE